MTKSIDSKPVTKRPREMAREPQVQVTLGTKAGNEPAVQLADPQRMRPSKSGLVLELLERPDGASIDQLVAATGCKLRETGNGHALVR